MGSNTPTPGNFCALLEERPFPGLANNSPGAIDPIRISAGRDASPRAQQLRQEASFCNGLAAGPRRWLEDLKGISADVYDKRANHRVAGPVRVAILDTGLNLVMPFYRDEDDGPRRRSQIKRWRDFVRPANSNAADDFGHGTLMVRLVAECAPFAEIMVARVARKSADLAACQDNVAEAIRWADQLGADIISMSFGFPREHRGINSAIQAVADRDGGAILLASPGNSPYENESFPARHPAVLSIYATNKYGTFTESNAARPLNGADVLGTFGDDLPSDLCREFEQVYPGLCLRGSSVATAVAAGIGAVVLAYGAVLPEFPRSLYRGNAQQVLRQMHSSQGMAAVFRAMAQDKSMGRWFLNPARFWQRKNGDLPKFCAIFDCLWEVDREQPLQST